ncbi:MAG: FtsK/SpoIIIE domain-containing protein [Propionibacteriaceae bacterium]|nr:FtsK/SpoIIIE domain-containing protein [Propionibacteriaceae bacterium]
MKIKLTLVMDSGPRDIAVTADATATIGDVAGTIEKSLAFQGGYAVNLDPRELTLQTLSSTGDVERTLLSQSSLTEAGLLSGARIRLARSETTTRTGDDAGAAAHLLVMSGPSQGRSFALRSGPNTIGRSPQADITIDDPFISAIHARLVVSDRIEIIDMNSANGFAVGAGLVQRTHLEPFDIVTMGDTQFRVERNLAAGAASSWTTAIEFNRSPQVWPAYPGETFALPQPPGPNKPGKFPLVAMVAPLAMGVVMYAVSHNMMSIIFVALSPVLAIGTWLDRLITQRREKKQQLATFQEEIDALKAHIAEAHANEQRVRVEELPTLDKLINSVLELAPLLWSRRPDQESFLTLSAGRGTAKSRSTTEVPMRGEGTNDLWKLVTELQETASTIEDVPIPVPLRETRNLGIAGTSAWLDSVACAIVAQLACLHSPAEVTIAAIASAGSSRRWEWLVWLPHVGSTHSPIGGPHLATSPAEVSSLVSRLEELSAQRKGQRGPQTALPAVILLVQNDAPIDRGRLVSLAEDGPSVGIHLIWIAPEQTGLPASCGAYMIENHAEHTTEIGFTKDNTVIGLTSCEQLDSARALDIARRMSPIQDIGAPVIDQSDLPRSISYLALAGPRLADDPQFTLTRWRESGSLLGPGEMPPASGTNLRGLIGQGAHGEFVLDLRIHGPHALVGGTTGAGKSEFLQAWVLGMAGANSPKRLTFLFVDYKGGAAFADCITLPHCVGLVTDLSSHLVRRALTSLKAELRYREHLLNDKKAKDLVSLEATGDPDCPPSLVIIVDEFAALANEIPEFVDGVVDVAQRGRSLGMHLIMATQRPAGVIKDNLRANTNLRIALRMADEADSEDVIGTKTAAHFDSRIPGRGAVRTGPGRITLFQSGYAGGTTTNEPEPARIDIETLCFGAGVGWEVPSPPRSEAKPSGPKDISRIVSSICQASATANIPEPRKPWLPDLSATYDLSTLLGGTIQRGQAQVTDLALGIADDPENQAQHPVFWNPDDGNLAIYGTSGSGKSTTLRTIAISASVLAKIGRTDIYGFDAGTSGLAMLSPLPHVGAIIEAEDSERVERLLRRLVTDMDDRATKFSAVRAGSLADYRRISGEVTLPRIIVLIDGFSAFRERYEMQTGNAASYSLLSRILAEGRGVGIHVALTAERPNAISTSLSSTIQKRLVLRQAEESTYSLLNIPKDVLDSSSPPGRGVFAEGTNEMQVAILTGTSDTEKQAGAIDSLAKSMAQVGIEQTPGVERLPEVIQITQVPDSVNDQPVLGMARDTLDLFGFAPRGPFIVAGMPGSGRTTTLRYLIRALKRWDPSLPMYYIGPSRSVLHSEGIWAESAKSEDEIIALCKYLQPQLDTPANDRAGITLMIEGLSEYPGTPMENAMVGVIKAGRRNGHLIIGESETSGWGSGWPIISEIRNGRRGLILQPDAADGDLIFKMNFPRMSRSDYPVGRGVAVDAGKYRVVQVPLPE